MCSMHSPEAQSPREKTWEPRKQEHDGAMKDGGYGWVIVASTFVAQSVISFHFLTFGIFAQEFTEHFKLSEYDIGSIVSLRQGLFSIAGAFSGQLVQRFGCRPVAISGVLLSAFAFITTSFVKHRIALIITYGFIAGIGNGILAIPLIVIVQQYFSTRRAIAAGISSVGADFFSFLSSPLARLLVDTFGWRGASLLFGGLTLQMLVPAALCRPLEPHRTNQVIALAKKQAAKTWRELLKEYVRYVFNRQLYTRFYLLFLVTHTTRVAILDTYFVRMALIARSIGIDDTKAALLPSVIAIFATAARALSGFLGHHIKPHILYGLFTFLSSLVVLVVPLMPHTFVVYAICAAIFGTCFGSFVGIQHTTLTTLVGVKLLPLALSLSCLVVGTFQIISNLVVGWLLDLTGTYRIPLWYAGTVHLCGSFAAIAIIILKWREAKVRQRQAEKPNKF